MDAGMQKYVGEYYQLLVTRPGEWHPIVYGTWSQQREIQKIVVDMLTLFGIAYLDSWSARSGGISIWVFKPKDTAKPESETKQDQELQAWGNRISL